jgi:hypothetical protein
MMILMRISMAGTWTGCKRARGTRNLHDVPKNDELNMTTNGFDYDNNVYTPPIAQHAKYSTQTNRCNTTK